MKPVNPNAFWFALILANVSTSEIAQFLFALVALLFAILELIELYIKRIRHD